MEGMEEKLGSILGNPQMMQQIMSMAQALGSSTPQQEKPQPQPQPQPPGLDPAMLQKMMPIIQGSSIDGNQRALLHALNPYLSRDRLDRLERAMRAAKLANLVSGFLGGGSHV